MLTSNRATWTLAIGILLLTSSVRPTGQDREAFQARLTSLPVDAVTAPSMRGSGSATASFDGKTLTISGKFDGLNSPATVAHLCRAIPGVRGPSAFDLTVSKDVRGTVEGKLPLTSSQAADLRKGWYYIQIHTEANPDGHIRGWLLK